MARRRYLLWFVGVFLGEAVHTDTLLPSGLFWWWGPPVDRFLRIVNSYTNLFLITNQTSHCFHKILSLDCSWLIWSCLSICFCSWLLYEPPKWFVSPWYCAKHFLRWAFLLCLCQLYVRLHFVRWVHRTEYLFDTTYWYCDWSCHFCSDKASDETDFWLLIILRKNHILCG